MKVQFYVGKPGLFRRKQWRWRVVSKGRITAISPDGYNNPQDMLDSYHNLALGLRKAPVEWLDHWEATD